MKGGRPCSQSCSENQHYQPIIFALIANEAPSDPPENISQQSFNTCTLNPTPANTQMFAGFVKEITSPSTDKPRTQPSTADIKGAILHFPGHVVTFHSRQKVFTTVTTKCAETGVQAMPTSHHQIFVKKPAAIIIQPNQCPMQPPSSRK